MVEEPAGESAWEVEAKREMAMGNKVNATRSCVIIRVSDVKRRGQLMHGSERGTKEKDQVPRGAWLPAIKASAGYGRRINIVLRYLRALSLREDSVYGQTDELSHPKLHQQRDELADFSTDRRVLVLSGLAVGIGVAAALVAYALVWLIAVITNLAYYQRFSSQLRVAGRQSPGGLGGAGADDRRPGDRPDGALRLGEDPRPRHPRGAGSHPHRPQPRRAQGRRAQAGLLGDLHRHRRPVRRRGARSS